MNNLYQKLISTINEDKYNQIFEESFDVRLINSTPLMITDDFINAFVINNHIDILNEIEKLNNQDDLYYKIIITKFYFSNDLQYDNQNLIEIYIKDFSLEKIDNDKKNIKIEDIIEINNNETIKNIYEEKNINELLKPQINILSNELSLKPYINLTKINSKNNSKIEDLNVIKNPSTENLIEEKEKIDSLDLNLNILQIEDDNPFKSDPDEENEVEEIKTYINISSPKSKKNSILIYPKADDIISIKSNITISSSQSVEKKEIKYQRDGTKTYKIKKEDLTKLIKKKNPEPQISNLDISLDNSIEEINPRRFRANNKNSKRRLIDKLAAKTNRVQEIISII